MLSDHVGNASILQLYCAGSSIAVAVRGAIDLDCIFKGVPSISAEVCVEAVIAAGPAVLGLIPIVVRKVFGPTKVLVGQVEVDWFACRSSFLSQTQKVPAKSKLGEDYGAII